MTKKVSFTPNTITYTAKGPEAEKIKKSKIGVVVHTQYHGKDIHDLKSDPHPDVHRFKQHPDVWHKSAEHDTSKIDYPEKDQNEFHKHMESAKKIHEKHGEKMYSATERHQGASGHLETYINHTVRSDEKPSTEGFKNHLSAKLRKKAESYKTSASKEKIEKELNDHIQHIDKNKEHYDNLLKMHHHLQTAKNILVKNLNKHTGDLEHHIDGKKTDPEGYVIHHNGQASKLVNRSEFSKANLLKVRK